MGLHITLIRIVGHKTEHVNFLPEDENPELKSQFGHLISSRTADYGQGPEIIRGYYYEELGCQPSGVKGKFYKRYKPDEFLFTQKELEELTGYLDKAYVKSFKHELANKFIEGDTILWMGY